MVLRMLLAAKAALTPNWHVLHVRGMMEQRRG
jgi:hypothetical protein